MVVEAVEVKAMVKAMVEVMVVSLVEDMEEEEVDEERIMRPLLIAIIMKLNGLP
jgi:hypothetical protein